MKINATERKEQGTSASRRLRRAGKLPGIIYGNGEALPIVLDHNALWHTMRQEGAFTSILQLDVAGASTPVIVRDVQYHAYKPFITHIDFQRIDMKQTIVMRIPIAYIGAEESPAVKLEGQIINHVINDFEIECLPGDLPEHITVDLSKLEVDGVVRLSDITLPKGITIVHSHHEEEDPTLAIAAHVAEEVTPVEDEATAEVAEGAEGGAEKGKAEDDKKETKGEKEGE